MTALSPIKDITRYRIDLPKSYQRMERAFERYNGQFAKPKVKLPHLFLARELIRLYAREFARWQASRGFNVQLDWREMPLLAVNNQFLAEITGGTDRSIRNYRKVLEKAGFLAPLGADEDGAAIYSVHHGRTCDFELAISPDFLWVESNNSTACLRISNAPTTRMRKNFPPTSTSTKPEPKQEQQELVGGKLFSYAEKISASNQPEPPEQPEPSSGKQPELPSGNEPEPPASKQPEPVNRNEQRRQQAGQGEGAAAEAQSGAQRRALVRRYAKILLNYARAWLYPGEVMPAGREQAVLARIDTLYGQAPPEKLLKITHVYIHRLKLAQLYWHREHGPLPPPEQYFDPQNTEDGFILTKKWPDDREKYPPPARATYRLPTGRRRGAGRNKEVRTIGHVLQNRQ